MIITTIDSVIKDIADLRNELYNLNYNEQDYDRKETELHKLEDGLIKTHGDFLSLLLQTVHEDNGIKQDILTPIAYLARSYIKRVNQTYDVDDGFGALVDVADKARPSYLVIVPGPLRILLVHANNIKEVLWRGQN
jgi:hypothetical protein